MPRETPGTDCFELPKFLEGCIAKSSAGNLYPPLKPGWYRVLEPAFSYMVLGQYPAQAENQLISGEWLANARTRWDVYVQEHGEVPPEYTPGVMGLDVAEFGSDTNCLATRYGGFVEQIIAWGGVDTLVTADRASEEFRTRNVEVIQVDATGVGAGVAPSLQRNGCAASAIMAASRPTARSDLGEFTQMRDQLWWACREWLRVDPGAMLPPDEMLIEELRTPTYNTDTGKVKVMKTDIIKEKIKRSPDRASALCLTFAPKSYFSGCVID